jgi:hypothetical protein
MRVGVTFWLRVRLRNRLVRWKALSKGYREICMGLAFREDLKVSILDASFVVPQPGRARGSDAQRTVYAWDKLEQY